MFQASVHEHILFYNYIYYLSFFIQSHSLRIYTHDRSPERLGAHLPELIFCFMLSSPSDWLWQLVQPWLPVEGMRWVPADIISPDFMGIYSVCYHDSYFSNEVSFPGAQCFATGVPPPVFLQWLHFHLSPENFLASLLVSTTFQGWRMESGFYNFCLAKSLRELPS